MKEKPGPADPAYAERVRASFARQRVMSRLGAELTHQPGFLHAGIVATVADSACGYAAFSLMPAGAAVLTVESRS